eukprot:TRINITY_DN8685_c0_g3_i1.p1 TRINITY_DN8685_c0_g3~~TRINITY_DN8685_c0_g3_i1.p1  ORF type:complete len:198 (+),score=16.19 TRINITY_DN8685_c0_g3_i1:66-659(+)
MGTGEKQVRLGFLLSCGDQLATLQVHQSTTREELIGNLLPLLPAATPGFRVCISKLLHGTDSFDAGRTAQQMGLRDGSQLLVVFEEVLEFQHPGMYKCWYSDVREIFEMTMGVDGSVSVQVHDEVLGSRRRTADSVEFDETSLKFRLSDRRGYSLYKIDWENEGGPVMILADYSSDGVVCNSEWGWVVPYEEDFKPH